MRVTTEEVLDDMERKLAEIGEKIEAEKRRLLAHFMIKEFRPKREPETVSLKKEGGRIVAFTVTYTDGSTEEVPVESLGEKLH